MMQRIKKEPGTPIKSVIKVKINENDEIEYLDPDHNNDEIPIEYEIEEINENDEEDPLELVQTSDGHMFIKMEKDREVGGTIVEHICGKCHKGFPDFETLKKHMSRACTEEEKRKRKITVESTTIIPIKPNQRRILCYCCDEEKSYGHKGTFECTLCNFSFQNPMSLEKHQFTIHSTTTEFACTFAFCTATCPSQGILEMHMQTHRTNKPFSCDKCGKDFTRKYHLERHILYSTCDSSTKKSSHACEVCSKVFTRVDNLREHLRGHMGQSTKKKNFQCPHCTKAFYGSSLLNIHIRTHTGEKPFPCDLCDKSFSSTGALRKHRRKHTGEKPYECTVCQSRFSAKETLNRHFKIHTGERPHVCKICSKSFIQGTQLRSHMFHHTGENGFDCNFCGRVFNRKSRLSLHIKFLHEGATLIQCHQCNKHFLTESELKKHVEIHKGNKKFCCNECGKHFSTKGTLNVHEKIHVKENPCICEICSHKFIRMDCLVRHVRAHHRDVLFEIINEAEIKRMKIISKPEGEYKKTNDDISDGDEEDDDDEETEATKPVIRSKTVKERKPAQIDEVDEEEEEEEENDEMEVQEEEEEGTTIFMSDTDLMDSISELLNLLIDKETLSEFGWPESSVEDVLSSVIKRCGHAPADYKDCGDFTTKMRENAKLLFTVVIDDESMKSLLNNHTVDEVIIQVLKMSKNK